jgi:oligosaccharide reducing-end xylanase
MTVVALSRRMALVGLSLLFASCRGSLDSLGCTERSLIADGGMAASALKLAPLAGPASYPDAFRDLLGKSDSEISGKIERVFEQLFHGDPSTEAIFVPVGTDKAYIVDSFHNDVRTEGIGLAMIITVSLDKRDEFDRLWRYAKSIQVVDGAAQGYFPSQCNSPDTMSCYDPFGLQNVAMALLLARGRWQTSPGSIDYGSEAAALLDMIRNKEIYNCGVADRITAPFDAKSKLPYAEPTVASAGVSSPSIVMPAYYDLWYRATSDSFWQQAASAARAYWKASANSATGLMPVRAGFDGVAVPGFDTFSAESHRIPFNMALDGIWSGGQSWLVDESNQLLQFFNAQGLTTYGVEFSLAGKTIQSMHNGSLVAANGALALVATSDVRRDFANEVWNLTTPTGSTRYFAGIMQLTALVLMSGQLRVY